MSWRALVVTAHPDDMEFASGGTVALWADHGAEVTVCLVTDGSTGTQDRDLMGPPLAKIRSEESAAAAEVLGIHELMWMGYRDGLVEYDQDLKRDIARVFRTYRPHRFMVMDPTPTIEDRFINHPDHRAVGQASLDVSMTSGTTPGLFPELLDEGLDPWRGLAELWIAGPAGGPQVVDITSTVDRKIDALMCHHSQVGDNEEEIATWVRDSTSKTGAPHGYGFAESFRVIREGPGFHSGEQDEVDLAEPAPKDPRA